MTYEELNKSNIPLITMDFIDDAIIKFNYLKENIQNLENIRLDNDDLIYLCFLLSALSNDKFNALGTILKKSNIEEYRLGDYFNIRIGLIKEAKELEVGKRNEIYNKFFKDNIDMNLDYVSDISHLYPEDIILDLMEYFVFDNIFSKFNNNTESRLQLEEDLIEQKNNRISGKIIYKTKKGITFNKLSTNYLPSQTVIYIENALKWYNTLFNDNNYKNELIKTEEEKVYLCLFLPILESPSFSASKVILEYLSRYKIDKDAILNYFNINPVYLSEQPQYSNNELEYTYNKYFKEVLDKMFVAFRENVSYVDIRLESFYKNICLKEPIYSLYRKFNLTSQQIDNLVENLEKFEKVNSTKEKNKFFDMNDYTHNINGTKKEYQENKYDKDYDLLKKYGYFLDELEYITNPAIGREEELKNIMIALLKPNKSCILVGEAGVGKTAIVEGLAFLLKNNNVPEKLKNKKIISLTTNSLLAGCQYRGQFEENVKEVLEFIKDNKEIILFIDELHTVIGAGTAKEQQLDFSNILKPYLERGDVKIIGSTTKEEYDNIIIDSAFRRRFEKTIVKELDEEKIKLILVKEIEKLEITYNMKFDFSDREKNFIIDLLITLTRDKNKVYNDKVNNPDLILSILGDSFANASYYNRDKIILEDIKYAVNRCARIYESVRQREVLKLGLIEKSEEKVERKILEFPKNYS